MTITGGQFHKISLAQQLLTSARKSLVKNFFQISRANELWYTPTLRLLTPVNFCVLEIDASNDALCCVLSFSKWQEPCHSHCKLGSSREGQTLRCIVGRNGNFCPLIGLTLNVQSLHLHN